MSGKIILIVEGQNDGAIATQIIQCRYPNIETPKILRPTGRKPNISQLAEDIERLIRSALAMRKRNDCIAVLHDADRLSNPHNRSEYEKIERCCNANNIVHIEAVDEIESWLLADRGFCEWVETTASNWDNRRKPSDEVVRRLDHARKAKYRLENIPRIVAHLNGLNEGRSDSLSSALQHLENAPCIRQE